MAASSTSVVSQALDYLKDYAKVRNIKSPGVFLLNSGAPLTHSVYGNAVP